VGDILDSNQDLCSCCSTDLDQVDPPEAKG